MIFLFYFVIVLPSLLSSIQFYPFSFYSFWFYSSSFETLFCCFFLSAPLHLLFYCYLAFISPSLSYVFHFCLFVSICIYPFLPCYNSVSLTFSFPIRFLSSTRIFFFLSFSHSFLTYLTTFPTYPHPPDTHHSGQTNIPVSYAVTSEVKPKEGSARLLFD